MEFDRCENRRCRRGSLPTTSSSRPLTKLWPPLFLIVCIGLIYGLGHFIFSRNACSGVTSHTLRLGGTTLPPSSCEGDRPLTDEDLESYYEYSRKFADLKVKLLSESDGVPSLQSELPVRPREITIVTQASVDRWLQLEKMASSWGGALCVAVHVQTRAQIAATYEKAKALHERIEAQRHCRLHLQLVVEDGFETENEALTAAYPVNALRNVALGMATTDLVFLLDVDFVPNPGLHEQLTTDERVYADLVSRTTDTRQLLVVPAFEAAAVRDSSTDSGETQVQIPQTQEELLARWLNSSINLFRWFGNPNAHGPTSDSYFMHPLTVKPYHIQYTESYEPYVIGARAIIPQYDERFRGYGKNKVSHLLVCSFSGMSFVVLPKTWVWAIDHVKSNYFYEFRRQKQNALCGRDVTAVLYEILKMELQRLPKSST